MCGPLFGAQQNRGENVRPRRERKTGEAGFAAAALIVFLVIAGAVVCFLLMRKPQPAEPRNILLIVADTLRPDHLGCYGFDRPTSPNLDRLAEEGVLFSDFNTVIPATLPSFSSLLTSKYPKDHGAARNGYPLGEGHLRLSEVFRDGGFETAAFVASYCVSAEFGMARGFDHFDEEFAISTGLPHNKLVRKADAVSDAFISWLKETGKGRERRFFAMVHYFDPHWPYDQPDPWRVPFCERGKDLIVGAIRNVLDARKHLAEGGKPDQRCRDIHDLYSGEIAFMDHEINRVLDAVEEAGIAGETLVVFTADHAETFWEHPDYFDHGLYVYDTNLRIPLIFHWPGGLEGGRKIAAPLSSIDLAPTLLELAGLSVPGAFRGRSFAPLVRGEEDRTPSLLFAEACKPYDVEEGAPRLNFNKARSVRDGLWKFVTVPFMNNRRELYNLATDPNETTNLIRNPSYAEKADALAAELEQWAERFEKGKDAGPLDAETEEKLKALGY